MMLVNWLTLLLMTSNTSHTFINLPTFSNLPSLSLTL